MQQRWPMWFGLFAGLAAVTSGFALGDGLQDQWQHAARYTARVGFPLLILAYIARLKGSAKLRPDSKMAVSRDWPTPEARLSGAVQLSLGLARVAAAGEAVAKKELEPA